MPDSDRFTYRPLLPCRSMLMSCGRRRCLPVGPGYGSAGLGNGYPLRPNRVEFAGECASKFECSVLSHKAARLTIRNQRVVEC